MQNNLILISNVILTMNQGLIMGGLKLYEECRRECIGHTIRCNFD